MQSDLLFPSCNTSVAAHILLGSPSKQSHTNQSLRLTLLKEMSYEAPLHGARMSFGVFVVSCAYHSCLPLPTKRVCASTCRLRAYNVDVSIHKYEYSIVDIDNDVQSCRSLRDKLCMVNGRLIYTLRHIRQSTRSYTFSFTYIHLHTQVKYRKRNRIMSSASLD